MTHSSMEDILRRGIRRGEVRADVRVEVARELGHALLWHRFRVTGDEITANLVEHIVDAILIPYVAPSSLAAHARTAELAEAAARPPSTAFAAGVSRHRP